MYSAASRPAISANTARPKSIPAVTPPPVMMRPSCVTRSSVGKAPKAGSNSRDAQWQAARLPCSSPAAPSTRDPVQTEVT